jgi:hypothetical protein
MTTQTQTRPTPQTTIENIEAPGLLDKVVEATVAQLDGVASSYSSALADPALLPLRRSLLTAVAIEKLEKLLTGDIMARIMRLMNSDLGFLTDKDPTRNSKIKVDETYPESVVRRCVVAALLQGVFPVGNEMNIISGRLYIAQAGYMRKVREYPGISDLYVLPGIPAVLNGQMTCRVAATWKIGEVKMTLHDHEGKPGRLFAISNQTPYSTPDNNTGKALRKAYKAIYEYISGSVHTDDDDMGDGQAPTSPPAGNMNLGKPRTNGIASPKPETPEPQAGDEPSDLSATATTENPKETQTETAPVAKEEPPAGQLLPTDEQMNRQDLVDGLEAKIKACDSVTSKLVMLYADIDAAKSSLDNAAFLRLRGLVQTRLKVAKGKEGAK